MKVEELIKIVENGFRFIGYNKDEFVMFENKLLGDINTGLFYDLILINDNLKHLYVNNKLHMKKKKNSNIWIFVN